MLPAARGGALDAGKGDGEPEKGEGLGAGGDPNKPGADTPPDPVAPNPPEGVGEPKVGMLLPPPKGEAPENGDGDGAAPEKGVAVAGAPFEVGPGPLFVEKGDGEGAGAAPNVEGTSGGF